MLTYLLLSIMCTANGDHKPCEGGWEGVVGASSASFIKEVDHKVITSMVSRTMVAHCSAIHAWIDMRKAVCLFWQVRMCTLQVRSNASSDWLCTLGSAQSMAVSIVAPHGSWSAPWMECQ